MKKYILCVLCLLLLFPLVAEDTEDFFLNLDEDSLFGISEEDAVEKVEDSPSVLDSLKEEEEPFQWGGRIYSDLKSSWIWYSSPADLDRWADESQWDPRFGMDLFLDARPLEDYRVFCKLKAFYPFENQADALKLYELFADFNWDHKVYFRMGKQRIDWGVSYLYSPADRLNLSVLDPLNRNADREGPLALKTQIPLSQGNLYLYTVDNGSDDPADLTWAPKLEVLLGDWEAGIGAIYNSQLSPKGALFLTGPAGPVDFFSEALIQYGSDSPLLSDQDVYLSAASGFLFTQSKKRLTALAQYWYDGEVLSGHHFGGAVLEKGFLVNQELKRSPEVSLSLTWLGDFSDSSGMVVPEIALEPFDHGSIALGGTWRYGSESSYYRYRGMEPAAAGTEIYLNIKLGYGDF